ncbi:unnamed protein product [Alopecurus aequalis]
MTKVLCPQYEGSISQEPADTCESMDRSRTPPHVSQTTTDGSSGLAAMQNNPPYLALIWQSESHVTMIKLADDPSKQVKDFLSDNYASERFGACYVAPVNSIQEASKKEILVDLNANFHFNNQRHVERISSREGRSFHMKRKARIDQESPTSVGAFSTSPSKKRSCGDMSNQALSGPNHPNGKRPIDQALPTDVGTSPTGPLKKKRRTRLIVDLLNTVEAPCDAANLKSQKYLKLVSSSDGLCTEKEKRPNYYREKKKIPIPCRSNGSARTSIDGGQWLKWSKNATRVEKDSVRGNAAMQVEKPSLRERCFTKQSSRIDARTSRAKVQSLLVRAACPQLANSIQMKARIKELRLERSTIHGWGVLAVKEIDHDELIVEYIGQVIRKPLSDMREVLEHQHGKAGRGDYLFKIDANYGIDATRHGGIARYINHSCEPNCIPRIITVNGQKKIFIYAKNNIRAGEELTYNYKFPFEENKIPCLCGSKRCCGAMN